MSEQLKNHENNSDSGSSGWENLANVPFNKNNGISSREELKQSDKIFEHLQSLGAKKEILENSAFQDDIKNVLRDAESSHRNVEIINSNKELKLQLSSPDSKEKRLVEVYTINGNVVIGESSLTSNRNVFSGDSDRYGFKNASELINVDTLEHQTKETNYSVAENGALIAETNYISEYQRDALNPSTNERHSVYSAGRTEETKHITQDGVEAYRKVASYQPLEFNSKVLSTMQYRNGFPNGAKDTSLRMPSNISHNTIATRIDNETAEIFMNGNGEPYNGVKFKMPINSEHGTKRLSFNSAAINVAKQEEIERMQRDQIR